MRTLTINSITSAADGSITVAYVMDGSGNTELYFASKAALRDWLVYIEKQINEEAAFAFVIAAWMQATPNAVNPSALIGRTFSIDVAKFVTKAWAAG